MEELNVLYTINQKYVDICLTSLLSIIKNSNIPLIHCHIITSGFQKDDYQKLTRFLTKYQNVEIKCYPLENFNIAQFNIPNWRGTQIANARLFFQEIMNQEISKIKQLLYLDADTLTVSDLTKLKEFQNGFYAVKDYGTLLNEKREKGFKKYYNSGVLWIDIDNWINQNYQNRLIKFIAQNKNPLSYPDQDILNYTLMDEIKDLPMEYNVSDACFMYKSLFQILHFYPREISIREIHHAINKIAILHFYGLDAKPWVEGNLNPFSDDFMKMMMKVNPDFIKESLPDSLKKYSKYPKFYYYYPKIQGYIPKQIKTVAKRILINNCNEE